MHQDIHIILGFIKAKTKKEKKHGLQIPTPDLIWIEIGMIWVLLDSLPCSGGWASATPARIQEKERDFCVFKLGLKSQSFFTKEDIMYILFLPFSPKNFQEWQKQKLSLCPWRS